MQLGYKINLAKTLAGVKEELKNPEEPDGFFKRVLDDNS